MRARVVLALAATLCAPALHTSASAQVVSPRSVLVIHSGAESFPSNPILDAGIRETLASRSDLSIDYYTEYLESDLFPEERASLAFTDYIRRKYEGRRIDLVIAMTSAGLRFVLDHRGELFPDAPIVFYGLVAPDDITRDVGGGVTGITTGVAYAETLKLALALHPSTQRVFVVASGPDEQLGSVRAEFREFSGRVTITYLNEKTVPLLLSAVKAIPPGSVILYIWHSQTDPGNVVYTDRVARLVADGATVPVYGTSDLYIGAGIVGGVVRSTHETGRRIGEMALRILTGTRAQDIPIEAGRVAPVVDWRQLQRWGIAPARLPAGSQVLFREPSAWERYKVYIVGAVTALFAQSALIGRLLIQRARRRKAEQEVHRSQAALRTSYARIRDLGSRLLDAQEEERSRIARELHDDISQQLVVLMLDMKLPARTPQGGAEAMAAEASKRLERIIRSVHALSHRLHPGWLRLLGLVEALEGLQAEMARPDVTITFTHENVPSKLAPVLTLSMFRIAQEALQNALKHSKAHRVSMDLRGESDAVALTIVDDGVGFDVDGAWGRGLGLISVHERIEAIGGALEIHSSPGAGTRLEVRVPSSVSHDSEAVSV
ncbi:MAG: ABC transporter substrate binding protein [Vicinamibacterales bacterium]